MAFLLDRGKSKESALKRNILAYEFKHIWTERCNVVAIQNVMSKWRV